MSNAVIEKLAEEVGLTQKAAKEQYTNVIKAIEDALTDTGEAHLIGLGKLVIGERAARTGRNPKTGEPVDIAASKTVRFKTAAPLKRALNGE